jgi:hypothetical protein
MFPGHHCSARRDAATIPTPGLREGHPMRATRFVITLLAVLAPGSAVAMTTYVYCINDRIEVDPRDPQQMRSDRGDSEICIIGPSFDFGPDARRWVEANLRAGVGGACTCK